MKYEDTIIVIPARFGSTRLPGKALADINGKPMVVRVMDIAKTAGLCEVLVATEAQQIVDVVSAAGGEAILTDDNLQSGTDRVHQALGKYKARTGKEYKYVINLQGDMPNVGPQVIIAVIELLHANPDVQIATAIAEITDQSWRELPQVVKAVIAYNDNQNCHRALYFSRSNVPHGEGKAYAHLGIYGYKKEALEQFVNLPVSKLEKSEKLEQLRALENGMKIYCALVEKFPISVDVQSDLDKARKEIK